MPTGPLPPNPAELLESPRMEGLVRELAEADVDLVLIDCPPVLPVADSLAIGQLADGVIMIAAAGQTRISHLRDALRRLERVRASVIGVVLNGVVVRSHQYQYYGVRTAPDGPAPGADGSGLGPRTPAGPSTGLEALPPPPPPVAVR
jgi:succinoglycan biosynthesis transport protein ExoP